MQKSYHQKTNRKRHHKCGEQFIFGPPTHKECGELRHNEGLYEMCKNIPLSTHIIIKTQVGR